MFMIGDRFVGEGLQTLPYKTFARITCLERQLSS